MGELGLQPEKGTQWGNENITQQGPGAISQGSLACGRGLPPLPVSALERKVAKRDDLAMSTCPGGLKQRQRTTFLSSLWLHSSPTRSDPGSRRRLLSGGKTLDKHPPASVSLCTAARSATARSPPGATEGQRASDTPGDCCRQEPGLFLR